MAGCSSQGHSLTQSEPLACSGRTVQARRSLVEHRRQASSRPWASACGLLGPRRATGQPRCRATNAITAASSRQIEQRDEPADLRPLQHDVDGGASRGSTPAAPADRPRRRAHSTPMTSIEASPAMSGTSARPTTATSERRWETAWSLAAARAQRPHHQQDSRVFDE